MSLRRAGRDLCRRQPIILHISVVAQDELVIAVKHGDALDDIVERRIKMQLLDSEFLVLLAQPTVLLLNLRIEPIAFGNVFGRTVQRG